MTKLSYSVIFVIYAVISCHVTRIILCHMSRRYINEKAMTREAFIKHVTDELTEGGVIPASPSITRINQIIDKSLAYFYDHDDDSHEYQYLVVSPSAFNTDLFRLKRQIAFPKSVHAVMRFRQTRQNSFMGNSYLMGGDFRGTNYNLRMAINGDSEAYLTAIASSYFYQQIEKFCISDVQYDYSSISNMLTVIGVDPKASCVAHVSVKVPDEAMFEHELFFRYVCGQCKVSIASIFGFTDQKLIAGYKIDHASIKNEGKELVKDVLQELQDKRTGDFMDFFD